MSCMDGSVATRAKRDKVAYRIIRTRLLEQRERLQMMNFDNTSGVAVSTRRFNSAGEAPFAMHA